MLGFAPMTGVAGSTSGGSSSTSMFGTLTSLGLTSGLKMCLDAGDINSYATGQTWSDTSGNGTNFYRGSNSGSEASDPTFNGTPGNLTSSEYWSFDGGDYFSLAAGSNPAWVNTLHIASTVWSWCGWAYIASANLGVAHILFSSEDNGFGKGIAISASNSTANKPQLLFNNGTAGFISYSAGTVVTGDAWNFVGMSTTNTDSHAYQTITNATTGSGTLSSSFTFASSGNASTVGSIGSRDAGASSRWPSGSRVASLAMWQGVELSTSNLLAIYNATKAQFGY